MLYICEQCNTSFKAPPCQKARFCDRKCYDKSREGIFKCDNCGIEFSYYKSHKKGKKIFCSQKCHMAYITSSSDHHPNWKGKDYRKIIEINLKRKLKSSEIIHHINGNHFDNRIENLEITNRNEHPKKHLKNGFQKGHPQLNTGRTWFKKGYESR